MKLLGFIKEYDDISGASALDDLLYSGTGVQEDIQKVIAYLNQGYVLIGWMGYCFDVRSREPIGPDMYLTDGIWVWPGYLSYYLNKYPNFKFSSEFLEYIKKKDFRFNLEQDFELYKDKFEKELSEKLNGC